jgi:predicted DNA-binding transcriptional regulator AlpA
MQSENDVPYLLRFRDLAERGIATTFQALKNLQDKEGFPTGFLLGPSTRAWRADEVNAWIASRPTAKSRQTVERAARSIAARRERAAS